MRRIVGSRHNLVLEEERGEREGERGGTGILFEEPNPTVSRPRDLIGLCRTTKRRPQPWHGNGTGIPRGGTGFLFEEPNPEREPPKRPNWAL